jgi:methylated-DNA-[protein]-cysteine S-methyltransferase
MIRFSKGPKVCIALEFEAVQFKKASLAFSNRFECSIQGDVEKELRERLLTFLENYGKKNPSPLELSVEHLSPFRKKALGHLQQVPFGEVVTYGELAANIGQPKAARAIGMACHHNPYPLFIPCHRVIASGKRLGGFAYDLKMKQLLLNFESLDPI